MHYRQYAKRAGRNLFKTECPFTQVAIAMLFNPLVLNLLIATEKGLECTLSLTTRPFASDLAFRLNPTLWTRGATTTAAFRPVDNRIYILPEDYPSIGAFVVTEDTRRVTLVSWLLHLNTAGP
ncbi:hypothetical protein L227DRAFT_581458 [Lentinus tigrinus ALCF2SS1-6]|uniref:Uncharacterized protein n=1 Tax=Lentinus tigrinus ALCF2SS1-6 TaxID=1328759 RepID=A0A5C2RNX4_9APHY|nr:hypothetical protein L227DRAFT_581458 [Lentinus tigrinus ALCF2SS1-6]